MIWGRPSLQTILVVFLLSVGLMACGAPDQATRPTAMDEQGASAQNQPMAAQPQVMGISAEASGQQTRVVLQGNSPLTYTAFLLDEPPVVVVDVGAQATPQALGLTAVENGTVDKIEVESVEGMERLSRVRINLTGRTTYHVAREGDNLVVTLDNLAGSPAKAGLQPSENYDAAYVAPSSQAPGAAVVKAVDFKPLGDTGRTRLMIQTDKSIEPQVLARDEGKTIILSISPASIHPHLVRPLDTTYFRSAVNYIKPAPAKGGGVQFLIRLRDVVPYHLGQKGALTYVDFDSSDMAPRTAALPGPAAVESTAVGAGQAGTAQAKPVTVATAGANEPKVYKGQRISLDFQNADIHNILRLIGEVSGKNVVVSDKVVAKVTLKLKEVPWDQALDIILAANQLGVVESGNVLRIDKIEFLRAEKERMLKEQEIDEQQALKVPLVKQVFTPKYAAVANMKEELDKLKSERGKLTVIGNDIYVEEEPLILAQMADVFNKNDLVAKQILIESRIVEATSTFSRNLGVNWGGDYTINDNPGVVDGTISLYGTGSGGAPGAGGAAVNLISPPSTGLGLGFALATSAFNLDAQLYASEQAGEARIVSAPRILANNDQEVYIKQGQSIPYETSGTTTAPATISYNEAVLELKVKPHIEENGEIISMDIQVTKDSADYSRTTRNPPINKREAKTKLMVRNGQTVVIGGIIIDEKSKSINRVPGLHRIPILGWLFKNDQISDSKLELLIFLTSHIIPVKI